jgi:hypothetical protein
MAEDYLRLYARLAAAQRAPGATPLQASRAARPLAPSGVSR